MNDVHDSVNYIFCYINAIVSIFLYDTAYTDTCWFLLFHFHVFIEFSRSWKLYILVICFYIPIKNILLKFGSNFLRIILVKNNLIVCSFDSFSKFLQDLVLKPIHSCYSVIQVIINQKLQIKFEVNKFG